MATDVATDRVKEELHRAIDDTRRDLTRVEILAAALIAFARPVPDYEPAFRHTLRITRGVHEFGHTE